MYRMERRWLPKVIDSITDTVKDLGYTLERRVKKWTFNDLCRTIKANFILPTNFEYVVALAVEDLLNSGELFRYPTNPISFSFKSYLLHENISSRVGQAIPDYGAPPAKRAKTSGDYSPVVKTTITYNEEQEYTIDDLPNELLAFIFGYLDQTERISVAQVSKTWYALSKHPSLWREIKIFKKEHFESVEDWMTVLKSEQQYCDLRKIVIVERLVTWVQLLIQRFVEEFELLPLKRVRCIKILSTMQISSQPDDLIISSLSKLIPLLKRLQYLSIKDCQIVGNLNRLFTELPKKIEKLDLRCEIASQRKDKEKFSLLLPELKVLKLPNEFLALKPFYVITSPKLEFLDGSRMNPSSLHFFFSKCIDTVSTLKRIILPKANDSSLLSKILSFGNRLEFLRSLTVSIQRGEELDQIFWRFPILEDVSISPGISAGTISLPISHFQIEVPIIYFSIEDCELFRSVERFHCCFPRLKKLRLVNCNLLCSGLDDSLGNLDHLTEVEMDFMNLLPDTKHLLIALSKCQKIENLRLVFRRFDFPEDILGLLESDHLSSSLTSLTFSVPTLSEGLLQQIIDKCHLLQSVGTNIPLNNLRQTNPKIKFHQVMIVT